MKEYAALTVDDALYRFRLRVFALAEELGSVRMACRVMGGSPLDVLPVAAHGAAIWARDAARRSGVWTRPVHDPTRLHGTRGGARSHSTEVRLSLTPATVSRAIPTIAGFQVPP